MVRRPRQGWALFAAMTRPVPRRRRASPTGPSARGNPLLDAALGGRRRRPATWRARRSRFGIASSALWATVTTAASSGAVNAMHDSFTPLGGLVPLFNMQLGEVVFGGVGAGLYGMLVFVDARRLHRRADGRPHARVPRQEDRGARDEAGDARASWCCPLRASSASRAWRRSLPDGARGARQPRAARLREILYAFTSAAGNNGSAFAGLTRTRPSTTRRSGSRCCSAASG